MTLASLVVVLVAYAASSIGAFNLGNALGAVLGGGVIASGSAILWSHLRALHVRQSVSRSCFSEPGSDLSTLPSQRHERMAPSREA